LGSIKFLEFSIVEFREALAGKSLLSGELQGRSRVKVGVNKLIGRGIHLGAVVNHRVYHRDGEGGLPKWQRLPQHESMCKNYTTVQYSFEKPLP